MFENGGGVGLVRRLVRGKSGVAMDPIHRPAVSSRIDSEGRADGGHPRSQIADELQKRRLDVGDVSIAVRLEPVATVVGLEIAQEREQSGSEVCSHGAARCCMILS